jgi:twitching motility protein PilT
MASLDGDALDLFLAELCRRGGSDLLLTVGAPPMVRIDGRLVPLDAPPLTADDTDVLTTAALGSPRAARFLAEQELDFSFGRPNLARFRANAFHQRGSAALAVRLIPFVVPSTTDLRLPPSVTQLTNLPQGLVLVTGPTGSGKSTTLASLLDAINRTRPCHILTIEDPIEYLHSHKRSAVNQREIGTDSDSFARALRSALREDPDVVMVGEMRDLETVSTALTIAETGHLVLASLHTNDASQTVDRIVDVFPAGQQAQVRTQLAGVLEAIVSQRLVPRVGGGRVGAFEVLLANAAVRNLVREGRTNQIRNQIMTGASEGMQTLETSLSALVTDGLVDVDVARAYCARPADLRGPAVKS